MPVQRVHKDTLLDSFPAPWPDDVLTDIKQAVAAAHRSIVVVDDDPTGTQTVHQIPVLTEWSCTAIEKEFIAQTPLFYIQTNSRSLSSVRAREIAQEVGEHLLAAYRAIGRSFSVISRSDSTLRGHFPAEVDALLQHIGREEAVRVLIPFFLEGGRYTIKDIHWVEEEGILVPAGETPFARDATFGYRSSNLCEWVEEKTQGSVRSKDVASISINTIRDEGPEGVKRVLMGLQPGSVCIVNAATMHDLEVATLGCLRAEYEGKILLYRTGASFVRAYAGQEAQPLLTGADLQLPDEGAGLIIVGSHVPMSTRQLEHVLLHKEVVSVELEVAELLRPDARKQVLRRVSARVQEALVSGQDVVLYTSRQLHTGHSGDDSLRIAGVVSSGIVSIVSELQVRPRYIVAKGGITSSDVATRGLGVRRAFVLGQIIPGVPVNQLGEECRFPGLIYIVFPGNVGGVDGVTRVVHQLSPRSS